MDYLEKLLKPISEDNVCGENLEDDAAFQNFFFTAQGEPEKFDGENTIPAEAPDWRNVEKQALGFLEQTKDLKLISILAQSVLNTKGIKPFSECLTALASLLDEQWQEVFPLLDEDDGDPLERVAALSYLNDAFIIIGLKNTPLASAKGAGTITIREVEQAETQGDSASFTVSQIKGVFQETNSQELQLLHEHLAYSLESVYRINERISDSAGHQYTVNFDSLIALLTQLKAALETYADVNQSSEGGECDDGASQESEYGEDETSHTKANTQNASNVMTTIKSREDVERCLELINDYYKDCEPSSPIPVLVNRAKKLVHKDFMAIVQDIYPDAVSAVQHLGGIDPDENSEREDDDW